jgi:hypothetical protein
MSDEGLGCGFPTLLTPPHSLLTPPAVDLSLCGPGFRRVCRFVTDPRSQDQPVWGDRIAVGGAEVCGNGRVSGATEGLRAGPSGPDECPMANVGHG